MSVEEFFKKYSIEEINKKTKISPISLRYIKNKEFDKLIRVKFIGFVRLIEKEYNIDLSELIEEYENFYEDKKPKEENKIVEIKEEPKNYFFIVLIILLFVGSASLYFGFLNKKEQNNEIKIQKTFETNETNEDKSLDRTNNIVMKTNNISSTTIEEKNLTSNAIKDYNITIIPNEKLWFKALNIDTNKTKEFLTTHKKIFKGNYYMKFGHGNLTIMYNSHMITPNTKKIIRILFKNGEYKFLNKPNEYEK